VPLYLYPKECQIKPRAWIIKLQIPNYKSQTNHNSKWPNYKPSNFFY
jgi:hypothetical protein